MLISPEILNKVWSRWCEAHCEPDSMHTLWQYAEYGTVSRRGNTAQRFEDWLFTQGAIVQQLNHKRFLYFSDDQQASWFMLRYS